VRLGLDEPPEPVVCRCRDTSRIFNSIQNKIAGAHTVQQLVPNTLMDFLAELDIDPALIDSVSARPNRQMALRLESNLTQMRNSHQSWWEYFVRDGIFWPVRITFLTGSCNRPT